MKNKILIFILTLFVCILSMQLQAEEAIKGEIINISKQYRIAFADIGNKFVNVGDVVEVTVDNGNKVYLVVMEVSPVLSKLAIISSGDRKTNLEDFGNIQISNPVYITAAKASFSQQSNVDTQASSETTAVSNQDLPSLSQQLLELNEKNAQLNKQVILLTQERENLEKKVSQSDNSEVLNQSLQKLKEENQSYHQENSRLAQENQQLKNKNETAAGEIQDLQEKVNILKTKLESMIHVVNQYVSENESKQ